MNSYLMTHGNDSRLGDFTGTARFDPSRRSLTDFLAATSPGRVSVWVYRNDQPVWGGIIWARTYASQAGTYQLYGQTFDSYLRGQFYSVDRSWNDDIRNIIRNVWLDCYAQGPDYQIGLELPDAVTSVKNSEKNVVGNEFTCYRDVVDNMVAIGAEYRIGYYLAADGTPRARLESGRWDGLAPTLGIPMSNASPGMTYPGNIISYWYSESGTKGGTDYYGIGKKEATTPPPRVIMTDPITATGERPRFAKKLNYSDLESEDLLVEKVTKVRDQNRLPVVSPTFKLMSVVREGEGLMFRVPQDVGWGTYGLGDYSYVVINDPRRFVTPFKAYYRVVGWTLKPPSDGNAEEDFDITIDQGSELNE
jgi:hypothetical protein